MSNLRDFALLRTPDQPRGFGAFMPRPISSEFLEFVAVHACTLPIFRQGSVHILAVANSGIPIGAAILMYRRAKKIPGCETDALSIVDPDHSGLILGPEATHQTQVIVDNSVKSLATINSVSHKLAANNLSVRNVVKLVDYQDEIEQETRQRLKDVGMDTHAIFTLSDIVNDLPKSERIGALSTIGPAHFTRGEN